MREPSIPQTAQQRSSHTSMTILWFLTMGVLSFGVTRFVISYSSADAQESLMSGDALVTNPQTQQPEPATPAEQQPAPAEHPQSGTPATPTAEDSSGSVPYHEQPMSKQEVADVLRQIKELRTQLKQIEKNAKKANTNSITNINELLGKLAAHEQALKNPTAQMTQREAASAFWDERLWEEVNNVRRMVDIPRELKDIERALLRAEKTIKKPRVQKVLSDYLTYGEQILVRVRKSFDAAKASFAAQDFETAEDNMRDARDESYPGEVEGVYEMLSNSMDSIRRVKDPAVREMFLDILQPVFDSIKEGDFHEANQALNEINRSLFALIDQAMRAPRKPSKAFTTKMQQLDQLLQQKYGSSAGRSHDNER